MIQCCMCGEMELGHSVSDVVFRKFDLEMRWKSGDALDEMYRPLACNVVCHKLLDYEVMKHGGNENIVHINISGTY